MNFFFSFSFPLHREASGAQRGDFPKAITRGTVKIQAQVCLTPPPRYSFSVTFPWGSSASDSGETVKPGRRRGADPASQHVAKWQHVPLLFNLGHLQCFSKVCWDPVTSAYSPICCSSVQASKLLLGENNFLL